MILPRPKAKQLQCEQREESTQESKGNLVQEVAIVRDVCHFMQRLVRELVHVSFSDQVCTDD